MDPDSQIADLITSRLKTLKLSRSAFIARSGYKNTAKGLRRLDALLAGDLKSTRDFVDRLPAALDVPEAVVIAAVEETRLQLQQRREGAERAAFKPHAIILTEHSIPTSITFAAFTGADKWKMVPLEGDQDQFVQNTMRVMEARLAMFGGSLPFFGRATGFVINYRWDLSVEYDLHGTAVDAQSVMKRAAVLTFGLRGNRSLLPLFR